MRAISFKGPEAPEPPVLPAPPSTVDGDALARAAWQSLVQDRTGVAARARESDSLTGRLVSAARLRLTFDNGQTADGTPGETVIQDGNVVTFRTNVLSQSACGKVRDMSIVDEHGNELVRLSPESKQEIVGRYLMFGDCVTLTVTLTI